MLSDHVSAAFARERRLAFRAQAEAARQVKQARQARRPSARAARAKAADPAGLTAAGKQVQLRDGSRVLIRPVRAADAQLVADGFARLSARSRELRFHAPKARLSAAELAYLTDIDHTDHEALGALTRDGQGAGIARYVRSAGDATSAEIAIAIVDEWQRRGLGTALIAQLSDRARQAGIERFTALVTADNSGVARLLRNLGARLVGRDGSFLEYEIPLAPEPEHDYGFGELIAAARQ
jgi:RimJ/RimL family protein N-acetyltransferase